MKDFVSFVLSPYCDDGDRKDVEKLNKVLKSFGVCVELKDFDGANILTFNYDTDVIRQKTTRNAGAKRKDLNTWKVSVAEIRARMETESADDVAKSLGISRSTLFRRLKEADEFGDETIF